MKKILLILSLFSALPFNALAQMDCENTMDCKVIAPSGMRMRSEPSLRSKVVTYVPKDSLLNACTGKFGAMTYEKINGFWRKVEYGKHQGYMFDGFLEILKINIPEPIIVDRIDSISDSLQIIADTSAPRRAKIDVEIVSKPEKIEIEKPSKEKKFFLLTESYNYCGDIQNIDPGMYWYGIYPKDDDDLNGNHRIKDAEINVILSKQKIGKGLEFDIQTTDAERSIFLIGSNVTLKSPKTIKIKDNSEILRFNSRKVFPGQQWTISGQGDPIVTLSATGSVESSGPCPDLKNYKLTLKGEKYFLPIEQNMTEEIVFNGLCGMPEVYWYGDLNGDKIPEIIFVSVYEDQNQFTLFVSDPKQENVLLTKEAEWVLSKCD